MANPTQSRPPSPEVNIEEIELQELPVLSIETSSNEPPPSSVSTTAEEVSLFIEGGSRNTGEELLSSLEVYDAICATNQENSDLRDHEVRVMYVNSDSRTCPEAVIEAMNISELRGEAVRLIYNDGEGLGCCFLGNRHSLPHTENRISQAIQARWNEFFSSSENLNREYIVFFFGNGGLYLQVALDNSIYSSRILCVGIGSSYYIQGDYRVQNYRLPGDWVTLLDYRGATAENTTTLPYADSAEGIFNPSIRCPSYQWALRYGEQCLISDYNEQIFVPPLSPPLEISLLVDLNRDPSAMTRLVEWINEGDSYTVREFNPQPNHCRDIALTALYATARISSLLQEILVLSVTYGVDVLVSYAIVTGYSTMTLRYFFLLLTNRPGCRRHLRALRLGVLGMQPLGFLTVLLDHINVARRVHRQPSLISAIFSVATFATGSFIYVDITRMFFTNLRSRVQFFVQRRLTGRNLPLGRVRVEHMESIRFSQSALTVFHGGIFMPIIIGVFNQLLIQVPRVIVRPNNPSVYDLNQTANEAWHSGDILAVGQTINFLFCMLLLVVNTFSFVRSVRRHLHRRPHR
ncbi:DUF687 domain-containing protein [Candidatus Chlamydia corallus]|uniref:DUF687 domain-containing protein n=1 Tax=Candidatus Chlamydia corallus TaxID=2038470 RepID=UPI000C2FAE0B|nr:DUF687 domain-containing protein [Candidatus Chlamydia corallus]